MSVVRRNLLIKDVKVFLRDVTQWSQLLLLLALVVMYLYNFQVLDLDRIPYMAGVIKNFYAFLNLGLAGFVMATVAARFVFPAVSSEGAAFWIIRTAPITSRDFLWSKFWSGLVPLLLMSLTLTVVANEFLAVAPFLKVVTARRHHVHELRARRPGDRAGRALSAIRRRQRVAGGGIAGRRRVHDRRRVVHHRRWSCLLGWPSSLYLWRMSRIHVRPFRAGRDRAHRRLLYRRRSS